VCLEQPVPAVVGRPEVDSGFGGEPSREPNRFVSHRRVKLNVTRNLANRVRAPGC
jgi:hypothetical protein